MTHITIYDTHTRTHQSFTPLDTSHVKMYVCGPTVYDFIHIGNARPLVVFDVLYRLLQSVYPKVTYVRNITDVDDKINARAEKNNETIEALTERTTQQFLDDCESLGTLPPTVQPRATAHITEMIAMIDTLIAKGHAYEADGHVLFRVKSWQEYGKFAKKDYDAQVQGARVEVAAYKEDPADFVLWKPSISTALGWHSPWGYGRPGWHIECSAMAQKHLGEVFDIHGGGLDLIFPHHQNEIAQSCCASDSGAFATYWMHNGFVMSEGEKMSKSLGNFYTVRELLQKYSGMAIRLVLLGTHYRKPLDFTKAKLDEAEAVLNKTADSIGGVADINTDGVRADISDFTDALADDLNTPKALAVLWQYRKNLSDNPTPQNKANIMGALHMLGLNITPTDTTQPTIPHHILDLAQQRQDAKFHKDFQTADALRDDMHTLGYDIKDLADGTYAVVKK